jgi:uncharacterized protein YbjT (DUF2867 family)
VIAVIGATGTVGRHVVDALSAPATVLVRSPERVRAAGHVVVRADLDDVASLRGALAGCHTLVAITPDRPDQARVEIAAFEAAASVGVQRIVKLSAQSAGLDPPLSFGRQHAEAERWLERSVMSSTSVRPVFFMQSLLFFADSVKAGRLIYPAGKGRVAFVDARDVAALLVRAAEDASMPRSVTITGPEAVSFADVAARMSSLVGRRVRHISPPAFVARRALPKLAGVPPWQARMIVELASAQRAGAQSEVSGGAARTLDAFLGEHRSAFAP